MNPLTLVKRTQKINSTEAALGISEEASWHAKYKESAYIFVGGISYDLTEGDLLAVFSQYGEVVDVNLVRDKATGKSKGFAFLAYEDQRSTTLAVDNLNGAKIIGRIVRVDHVSNYKKKEEEDEEERQKKREARGVCRAFQKGECKWGDACKFSHDEQRCANTGWGAQDREHKWNHDRYDDPPKSHKNFSRPAPDHGQHHRTREGDSSYKSANKDGHSLRSETKKDVKDDDYRESKRDRYAGRHTPEREREERLDEERHKQRRHEGIREERLDEERDKRRRHEGVREERLDEERDKRRRQGHEGRYSSSHSHRLKFLLASTSRCVDRQCVVKILFSDAHEFFVISMIGSEQRSKAALL